MRQPIAHIQLNVSSNDALRFYKELLTYLDFTTLDEWETGFGMGKDGFGLWVFVADEKYAKVGFHRKNIGINHLALMVESKDAVDKFYEDFLKPRDIKPLYESPKTFPEYTPDYYSVYFEDLDRIKLEVVFHS